jgi:hypothetical protein
LKASKQIASMEEEINGDSDSSMDERSSYEREVDAKTYGNKVALHEIVLVSGYMSKHANYASSFSYSLVPSLFQVRLIGVHCRLHG